MSTFPVQVFAYTCAQNVSVFSSPVIPSFAYLAQLFPIFNEIRENTQKRMNIVIGTSIGSAAVIYEIIALFGYLTFGTKVWPSLFSAPRKLIGGCKVGANIIAMYPSTSLFIAVGQLAIAILVMFSYPLQVHPCRNCLDKVFHAGHVAHVKTASGEEDPDEIEIEDEHGGNSDMSPLKHTLLTVAIIASGFTIAYFVDDLQMGERRCLEFLCGDDIPTRPRLQCYHLSAQRAQPQSRSSYLACSSGRYACLILRTARSLTNACGACSS